MKVSSRVCANDANVKNKGRGQAEGPRVDAKRCGCCCAVVYFFFVPLLCSVGCKTTAAVVGVSRSDGISLNCFAAESYL